MGMTVRKRSGAPGAPFSFALAGPPPAPALEPTATGLRDDRRPGGRALPPAALGDPELTSLTTPAGATGLVPGEPPGSWFLFETKMILLPALVGEPAAAAVVVITVGVGPVALLLRTEVGVGFRT